MNKNENIIGKNSSQKNYEMSNISPMKEILIERSESLSGPLAPLYLPKNKPQHSDLTVNVNKDRGNFIFKAKSQCNKNFTDITLLKKKYFLKTQKKHIATIM